MSDCRVEWADGGINRNQAATDTAIGEAVARYVSARRGLADGTRTYSGGATVSEEGKVPLPNLEDRAPEAEVPLAPEPEGSTTRIAGDLEAVFDVPVQVSAVLGRARMEISDLLKLGPGTVLELDRKVGEAIDIYVNNRLVARGEVVLVEEKLGVTMTEIIKAERS